MTGRRTWTPIRPGVPYPATTLEMARAEARGMRANVAKGNEAGDERKERVRVAKENQAAEANARLRTISLRQVFTRWQAVDLKPQLRADGTRSGRKDGGKYVEEQFERHVFPELGDQSIATLTRAEVLAVLDKQKAAGKLRTANVLLASLKQLFRFAADRELIPVSPIERIKKAAVGGSDVERDRSLADNEIALLAQQLPVANLARRSELAIWIILGTGCRIGELMGTTPVNAATPAAELRRICDAADVKFGVVDLARCTWYMPETKNQRDHTIHLSPFVVARFYELFALPRLGDWLYPNTKGNQPVSVKSFGKQLADRQRLPDRKLKNRTKETLSLSLPGGRWTAHDLRRTAATIMARLRVSNDVINECLNHKLSSRVTRVYVQDRRESEQREAFNLLGDRLDQLVSARP